jgi:hypothetical protein
MSNQFLEILFPTRNRSRSLKGARVILFLKLSSTVFYCTGFVLICIRKLPGNIASNFRGLGYARYKGGYAGGICHPYPGSFEGSEA